MMTTRQWPSGLRVIFDRERGTHRVGIAMLVGSGGNDDPPGREGVAHFIEHLAFRSKPSHRLPAWDELDFAGLASWTANPNAHTNFASTTYLGITAAERLPLVLPVMSSLVTAPLRDVDDTTLEVERNVVRRERYDVDPHAGGATMAASFAAVLPRGAPGSRPLEGTEASLTAITREDLEAFVAAHYRPENVIIALTGDLDPDVAAALIDRSFPREWLEAPTPRQPLNLNGAVELKVLNPPTQPVERPIVESRVPLRRLLVVWAVPGEALPSGFAMPLIKALLTMAVPAQVPGVRRHWSSLSADSQLSLLTLTCELEPEASPDTVSAYLREHVVFRTRPLPVLLRPRLDMLAEQNLVTRADRRVSALFSTGKPEPVELQNVARATAAFQLVQTKVVVWPRAREVLVMPLVRRNDSTAAQLPTVSTAAPALVVEPQAMQAVALGPPLGRTRNFTLSNGLQVLLSSRSGAPVVSVALGLRARRAQTTPEVAALLGFVLHWDHEALTSSVATPTVQVGADATVVSVSGPAHTLPSMLDLLGNNSPPRVEWVDYDGLEAAARRLESVEGAERSRWGRLAAQVMPEGSAALPPTLKQLQALSRARFVAFVDEAWAPDGAALVIDGSLKLDDTEALVREIFSGWRGPSRTLALVKGTPPTKPKRPTVVENQDAAVTTVRLACRLPAGLEAQGQPHLAGHALLAQALEHTFNEDLRRSRGVTYGASVNTTRFLTEENLLLLELLLDPRDGQAAARRVLQTLADLDGLLWSERDVDLARWHVAKERLGATLSSDEVARWLAEVAATGVAVQTVFPKALAAGQAHEVDAVWAACLDSLAIELEGERSSLERVVRAQTR